MMECGEQFAVMPGNSKMLWWSAGNLDSPVWVIHKHFGANYLVDECIIQSPQLSSYVPD